MAYNALAGGVLTGKYLDAPNSNTDDGAAAPRGRMDTRGWGRTLYRYRSGPADDATRRCAALTPKPDPDLDPTGPPGPKPEAGACWHYACAQV